MLPLWLANNLGQIGSTESILASASQGQVKVQRRCSASHFGAHTAGLRYVWTLARLGCASHLISRVTLFTSRAHRYEARAKLSILMAAGGQIQSQTH